MFTFNIPYKKRWKDWKGRYYVRYDNVSSKYEEMVLDVWNGDIDDIPIEELDKYFTSINKVCNDHLKLYDISKKIDFRKVISEYEY